MWRFNFMCPQRQLLLLALSSLSLLCPSLLWLVRGWKKEWNNDYWLSLVFSFALILYFFVTLFFYMSGRQLNYVSLQKKTEKNKVKKVEKGKHRQSSERNDKVSWYFSFGTVFAVERKEFIKKKEQLRSWVFEWKGWKTEDAD